MPREGSGRPILGTLSYDGAGTGIQVWRLSNAFFLSPCSFFYHICCSSLMVGSEIARPDLVSLSSRGALPAVVW